MGMTDKKQVLFDIERCICHVPDACRDCSKYKGVDGLRCMEELMADAYTLLKEQEDQIKNRDESLEKAREEIKWLRGMLKEQEAVEPVKEFIKGANRHEYHCKRCGNIVGIIFDDKHPIFPRAKVSIKHFCDVCGQAVKWE